MTFVSVRAAGGLGDLHHRFASVAAGLDEGLHMTGKLLGHSQAQATHRCAHTAANSVKQASERVATQLPRLFNGSGGDGSAGMSALTADVKEISAPQNEPSNA
jgi:hypothetical protein